MTDWTKEELEAVNFVLENLDDKLKCMRKLMTLDKQSRKKISDHLKVGIELAKNNFESLTRKVVKRSSELPTLVKNKNEQAITNTIESETKMPKSKETQPDSTKPLDKGISEEDLLGIKTVPVMRKSAQPVRIPAQEARRPSIIGVIQDGDYIDKEHKWGLITSDVVKKVLETATRENGNIIVQLPEPDEAEIKKGITWVNYL